MVRLDIARLHPDDIIAIASEAVRQFRMAEEVSLDQSFETSLPIADQKTRQQERMRQFKLAQKAKGG